MELLRVKKEVDLEGKISVSIDVGKNYTKKTVELVVFQSEEPQIKKFNKENINKYFGKLKWKGDPLQEQLRLRDEWE